MIITLTGRGAAGLAASVEGEAAAAATTSEAAAPATARRNSEDGWVKTDSR
jgi:hypothetical protein